MGIKTKNPDTMKSTILEGENAGFATTEADTEICAHHGSFRANRYSTSM